MVTTSRQASSYTARPRIWRSDIFLTKKEEIDTGRILSGTFSYNEDFDTKRQATIRVRIPETIKVLSDWIIAEIDIRDDVGNAFTVALGHFVAIEQDIEQTSTGRTSSIEFRDLTWIMRQSTITTPIVALAGTDHGAAARQIISDFGIPVPLINIPDSGTIISADILPDEKDDLLSFATRVLSGGGMYQPWVAQDYRVTSSKAVDVSTSPADIIFSGLDGAKILQVISNKPQVSGVRNQITIRKASPGEPIIEATATVTDESSRAHPLNIGRMMGANIPIILGRIDNESAIATIEDAQALADARLSIASTYLDRLNIQTYPDTQTMDGHKIIALDVRDGVTQLYTGNWLQRTWSVSIGTGPPIVSREMTRSVGWR